MQIGGRNLGKIFSAPFRACNWRAAFNMLWVYKNPMDAFRRYLFAGGQYPAEISLNGPTGKLLPTAYTHHDILTINEIFCRQDYPITSDARVVVDFGSNIGLSALFFLSRAPQSFVHCYEPLPWNVERLRKTLAGLEARYEINECAVGLETCNVDFFFEPSGRYGGISVTTGERMSVPCRSARDEIQRILERHGRIDVLKIDIEGLEEAVLNSLSADQIARIENIYVEAPIMRNDLPRSYRFRRYAGIAQFNAP